MDNLDENALTIFTDGSSYSNPRVGGTGFVFVWIKANGDAETYKYQTIGYRNATNQQMELQACIEALNFVNSKGSASLLDFTRFSKIIVRTDARYIVDNYVSAHYWQRQKWFNNEGRPIANAELWKLLLQQTKKAPKRVYFEWVKGHSKSEYNKQADKLARSSARIASSRQLTRVNVRRKKSPNIVSQGSVQLLGQRITIRIITDEWQKLQKCYRLKYEVMSKTSPYYQKIDWIYSNERLKAGHTYFVRLGSNNKSPWVDKKYHEKDA